MGGSYPELTREAETIAKWATAEEEGFRRTLAQGERLLSDLVRKARESETSWIDAADAFRLHDTYGFPYELTRELLADEGLSVDDQGFQRADGASARGGPRRRKRPPGGRGPHMSASSSSPARRASSTRFVGYETIESETVLAAFERSNGSFLAKLEESPFYPEGGGQVSDAGFVEAPSGRARVEQVFRLGDDQAVALALEQGELDAGEPVHAVVDRTRRFATMCNHTATHLLHAALRALLGDHVHQAGSYVGPDKLRFDFTHGERLSAEQLERVEGLVGEWIAESHPVRAIETTRVEAEALGAMALFGEKYGEWVRMVEVEDVSRELCGGTHVASTAEIGLFNITSESSSASNVRRIEAVTGAAAVAARTRARSRAARSGADAARAGARGASGRRASGYPGAGTLASARPAPIDCKRDALVERAEDVGGVRVVAEVGRRRRASRSCSSSPTASSRPSATPRSCSAAPPTAAFTSSRTSRRPRSSGEHGPARSCVPRRRWPAAVAAAATTMAQAGGRDPQKLPDAIAAARLVIERALSA